MSQNPNRNETQTQTQTQTQNQTQIPSPNPNPNPPQDFTVRETSPSLGHGSNRVSTTFDLVENMDFLYARVVKAKDLPPKEANTCYDLCVEVRLGNFKGVTKCFENNPNPEWNQVFSLLKDRIQSSWVEVIVKDKEMMGREDCIGKIVFEIRDVPRRVPPDSPLAPQWYRLENRGGGRVRGELMVAVWMGTQADEAFPDAWHLDSAGVHGDGVTNIRSKVYLSPKLWYLRVNVIEAKELEPSDKNKTAPDVFVKACLGNFVMKSKISQVKSVNPMWNEDLMFVAAEPFEEQLVLSVEDKVAPNKDEVLGRCTIPLKNVEKRPEMYCCKDANGAWRSSNSRGEVPFFGELARSESHNSVFDLLFNCWGRVFIRSREMFVFVHGFLCYEASKIPYWDAFVSVQLLQKVTRKSRQLIVRASFPAFVVSQ
ncbi:FT-interacting protein [Actinidia chinensis var. chinensis]|uniref:FT-interacting protein n=1 Tax=Actinidia chinensis var. chinensis TaxID=1590841 RepID=A0A2R6PRA8_ACTCC|nr:FT-interacting protein [Actinidia chinensis var. chinensis]